MTRYAADRDPDEPHHPTVVGGKLQHLSVSSIATFDPSQEGGCNRKFWFEKVAGLKGPEWGFQRHGVEVHGQVEESIKTGRNCMGAVARAGQHLVPFENGPALVAAGKLLVEHEFGKYERQPDGTWRPRAELTAAGVPVLGYVDLVNLSGYWTDDEGNRQLQARGEVEVRDWKTTSSIAEYAKRGDQLTATVQMPGYGEWARRNLPGVEVVRLSHAYFQTKGKYDASLRTALVPAERLARRWEEVEAVARSIVDVAAESDVAKVEPNRLACDAYRGCPYVLECALSPAELAKGVKMGLVDKIKQQAAAAGAQPQVAATAPTPSPALAKAEAASAVVEDDDVAKAEAMLAAAKAKREAAAKAAAEAEVKAKAEAEAAKQRAAVEAEKARLLAEEQAAKAKAPTVSDASGVLAPDAPAVTMPAGAQPMPPEEVMALASGPVKDAVVAHAAQAAGAPVPVPEKPAPKKSRSKVADAAGAAVAAAVDNPEGIHLYVDCAFEVGVMGDAFQDMAPYVEGICEALAKQVGPQCLDVRCAPEGSFLAFGKWKGALAAAVRLSPPPAGFYHLRHVRESEVKQVVVEAIRPLCRTLVRGTP